MASTSSAKSGVVLGQRMQASARLLQVAGDHE
jgi:hypothetical protein